jgi:rhamnogalacturonyl hydrolase YesR
MENGDIEDIIKLLSETAIREIFNFPKIPNRKLYCFKIKSLIKKVLFRHRVNCDFETDKYRWPNAILALALENIHSHHIRLRDNPLSVLEKYYDGWIKNKVSLYYLDNVMNGYTLIYLYQQTQNKTYRNAIEKIESYLLNKKLKNGNIPYRDGEGISTNILVDGIGLVCPFLCRCASLSHDNNKKYDFAIQQIENFFTYAMDKKTGIPYHGFNPQTNEKLGIIGWGRGVGWLLIGLVDSIEYINPTHQKYNLLCEYFIDIVAKVVQYQRNDGYFCWQLSAEDGPVDTSATAMILYAIAKGVQIGVLSIRDYYIRLNKGKDALHLSYKDDDIFNCSSEAVGPGMYPQVYGAYPWALGPAISFFTIFISLSNSITCLQKLYSNNTYFDIRSTGECK